MNNLGRKMRPCQQNDPRILVDPDDAWLLEWKWTIKRGWGGRLYASRLVRAAGECKHLFLHNVIIDAPDGREVDHINGNGLDDRRENLRIATRSQNQANQRLRADNSSGRKGVNANQGKWLASIRVAGRRLHLGVFTDLDEAARAYDRAALELHGEFALTNAMLGLLPVKEA